MELLDFINFFIKVMLKKIVACQTQYFPLITEIGISWMVLSVPSCDVVIF